MTDDQKVGFGNPPKSGQWKKGQSGNPNGRPKRKSDYIADYALILSEPVKAKQADGRIVKLESFEAAYVQICKKALNGDNAALFTAIRIMLYILPEGMKAEEEKVNEYAGAKEQFMQMLGMTEDEKASI